MKQNKQNLKRIFLISNMWPDIKSPGYGSFVKNVAAGLSDYGYSIVRKALIVGRPRDRKGKLRNYLSFYCNILIGFLRGGYDLVYIHFPNQAVPVLKQLYHIRKPKLVVNYHGEDLLYERGGYKEKLGKQTDVFLKRFATRIVVPSAFFKDIVVSRGIAEEKNVIVSPSGGISEEVFYPIDDASLDVPATYTQGRPLRLGYVGRLEDEKGIHDFMRALSELKAKGMSIKATVVGYGSLESAAVAFMNENGLEGTVEFVGGIPQHQLGEYYRSLDLFVFPTHAPESLGLTGIEALACGIPVVGSKIGGITTYLMDGINGLLVEPGDVDDLVGHIEDFSKLPVSRRMEMRRAGIDTGRKYYRKRVCEALSKEFDDLLNTKD